MSEIDRNNSLAARQGLEEHEARLIRLETEMMAARGQIQTMADLMTKLQHTNTLALARLRGTGATDGGND